ncbi:MAG: winged helix DNA-binding domain-containing protein [Thermoplasmata archaeon]|nr:winged helix DNA-binding domain-containing protein [Thermoplasmata archaeon]
MSLKPVGDAVEVSAEVVRRVAVSAQRLGRPPLRRVTERDVLDLVRHLGYVQLDPIQVVERSQHLVLYARLGTFDREILDRLQRDRRTITEYWAHAASIVPSEELAGHLALAAHSVGRPDVRDRQIARWKSDHAALRRSILDQLDAGGPLPSAAFADDSARGVDRSGWSIGRDVDRMLHFLWMDGELNVSHRTNGRRLWVRTQGWFPSQVRPVEGTPDQLAERFALRALEALGVATARQVQQYMAASWTAGTAPALERAVGESRAIRVTLPGSSRTARAAWYALPARRGDLERPVRAVPPRVSLLSPFDNLITNRDRTESLFGFHYRIEIYTPKRLRRFGYYSLPVLFGDRLVGRLDPVVDRPRRRLTVRAAHAEPGVEEGEVVGGEVQDALDRLARFVGAREVRISARRRAGWTAHLRSSRVGPD